MKRILMVFLVAFNALSVCVFPLQVLAHTDEALDKIVAPHGGQLRMAGPYHIELVLAKDRMDLYITDHAGVAKAAASAQASAVVLSGTSKAKLQFATVADNHMSVATTVAHNDNMQVVVQLTMAGEATQQAKFTPLKKHENDEHAEHQH